MTSNRYTGRRHEIYFTSSKDLDRWKIEAQRYNLSLSKWIYQIVEDALILRLESDKGSLYAEDISKLQVELHRLKTENKEKSARLVQLETELFNLRYHAFSEKNPRIAEFSNELIDLLKGGGVWSGRQIMRQLGIDPSNVDAILKISNQLALLADFEFIKETQKGWRWIG